MQDCHFVGAGHAREAIKGRTKLSLIGREHFAGMARSHRFCTRPKELRQLGWASAQRNQVACIPHQKASLTPRRGAKVSEKTITIG